MIASLNEESNPNFCPVQLSEKNAFKASSYMGEINEREAELNAARDKLLEQDEEMREISISREKIVLERDYLLNELKVMTQRMNDLQIKYNDQARLLLSVTAHVKNPGAQNMNQSMQ